MGRENFFILLDLPYDPASNDIDAINLVILRKSKEWARQKENPALRNQALRYLDMIPEMQRTMLDAELRGREAERARTQKDAMLRQFEAELRVLESKGYILPREAGAIVKKYAGYGVDGEFLKKLSHCPVAENHAALRGHREEAVGEAMDWKTAREIQQGLDALGLTDLYAFLEQPAQTPARGLRDAAARKKKEAFADDSPWRAVKRDLAEFALTVFASAASKDQYDRYRNISQYPAVGDLIQAEGARGGFIGSGLLVRLVNFGVEKYGIGVLEAEEYIRRFCAAYGIALDKAGQKIICPACGRIAGRREDVCRGCGEPLRGDCPGCGTPFAEGAAICSDCGFALGDMARALAYLDEAEKAIIESNAGSAGRALEYAEKYWPGHQKLPSLRQRVADVENRYVRYVEALGDCMSKNQYYAALELVSEAAAKQIRLPGGLSEQVRSTIRDFEEQIAALHANPRGPDYQTLAKLAGSVSDSTELNRMMEKHPPQSPRVLAPQIQGRKVLLQWSLSDSEGRVEYVLVRKPDAEPLTPYDGDILYQGPAQFFEDGSAAPLREYFYKVYTKRGASFASEGKLAGPVLIIPEIENLRVVPADMSAQLTWDFSPDLREVLIWRKLGGDAPASREDGVPLDNDRLDGYTDMKVKNDVEYWYYVVAGYTVKGRKVYAKGVPERVIPHKIVAPIEDLDIAPADGEEGVYVVHWPETRHEDVLLLACAQPHAYRSGDMLPVEELLTNFQRLELEAKLRDSARFRLAFSGGIYIFAAAVSGRFATVGNCRYLTNVPDLTEASYELTKEDMILRFTWPKEVEEVAVAYRFDRQPQHPEELGATVARYSREQYGQDGGAVLRELENGLYYITIYSRHTRPDGTFTYSKGLQIRVDNAPVNEVFYHFKYSKRLLSSTASVTITISSPGKITLPKAVFVGKVGRFPLCSAEGMPLFELEDELVLDGSVTYQYRTNMLPKNLYIRMFLHDESQYARCRLLPLSNVKIT